MHPTKISTMRGCERRLWVSGSTLLTNVQEHCKSFRPTHNVTRGHQRSPKDTRGHQVWLFKNHVHKSYFGNRIVYIWNSLPDYVINASTNNVIMTMNADVIGIGSRSQLWFLYTSFLSCFRVSFSLNHANIEVVVCFRYVLRFVATRNGDLMWIQRDTWRTDMESTRVVA